jgi:single-strand DNA-binding protein
MAYRSINTVTIVGRLGRDPEIRNTQAGKRIANLSVATGERWKDSNGEVQERTEWHRVVIFNDKVAEIAEKYARKGDMVGVQGALQTRKWTDQAGVERFSTEIVVQPFDGTFTLLSSPNADGNGQDGGGRQGGRDNDRRDTRQDDRRDDRRGANDDRRQTRDARGGGGGNGGGGWGGGGGGGGGGGNGADRRSPPPPDLDDDIPF